MAAYAPLFWASLSLYLLRVMSNDKKVFFIKNHVKIKNLIQFNLSTAYKFGNKWNWQFEHRHCGENGHWAVVKLIFTLFFLYNNI